MRDGLEMDNLLSDDVPLPHQPLDTLSVHDLSKLRQIIAEVIDDGDDGGYWKFHLGQHDIHIKAVTKADLDAVRNRFIEAVIAKVIATALQRNGDHQCECGLIQQAAMRPSMTLTIRLASGACCTMTKPSVK